MEIKLHTCILLLFSLTQAVVGSPDDTILKRSTSSDTAYEVLLLPALIVHSTCPDLLPKSLLEKLIVEPHFTLTAAGNGPL